MNFRIKDLDKSDRPREKLLKSGAETLTDSELIAILLGRGGKDISAIQLSQVLLARFNNIENISKVEASVLSKIKNIGLAKACTIKAAFEIGKRLISKKFTVLPKIEKPEDIYLLVKDKTYGKQVEFLYLISLNSRNQVLSIDLVTIGTVNETLISQREVIRQGLLRNAVFMILVHNHPSNDTNPSNEDIAATQRIFESCKLIGIPLLDHIIISDYGFTSIKALNLLGKGGENCDKP